MRTRSLIGPEAGPSSRARRRLIALAAAIATVAMLAGAPAVAAYTPGDNGHPTNGPYSDLKGGSGTFSFEQDAVLTCRGDDVASSFSFDLEYSSADLPAGATIVVYLSPNQGAINGNAGGDEAGYVAQVESNYVVVDVGGLSGSGSIDVHVDVTDHFTLATGGVLGVIATEADGSVVSSSKTNSLNCSEAAATATPTEGAATATPTEGAATATPTEGAATATPTEGAATATPTEGAATGTPASGSEQPVTGTPSGSPTLPSTSAEDVEGRSGGGPIVFLLVLMAAGAVGIVVLGPLPRRRR
jgi:hypothetical protein